MADVAFTPFAVSTDPSRRDPFPGRFASPPAAPAEFDGGVAAEQAAFAALSLRADLLVDLSVEGRARAAASVAPPAAPPEASSGFEDLFDRVLSDPKMQELIALLRGLSGEAADAFLERFRAFARGASGRVSGGEFADLAGRIGEGLAGVARGVERARSVAAAGLVQVEVRFEFFLEDTRVRAEVQGAMSDPIVLDLDGRGFDLTSYETGSVRFDLDGDGRPDRTAFIGSGTGLLALDRNGNGTIDDGRELFGDQHGAANGFAELAKFDGNGDGAIDRADPVYFRLLVWQDLNRDGKSSPDELATLADLGIERLDLATTERNETVNGNLLARSAAYYTRDGRAGGLGEAYFRYSTTV